MLRSIILILTMLWGCFAYSQSSSISPAKMLKPGTSGQVLSTVSGVATWVDQSALMGGVNYWTKSGSNLFYNIGSIGIGTTTPGSMLQVGGVATFVSANAGITIARPLATGTLEHHGIEVRDSVANGRSYNSFDSRFLVVTTPTGSNPHIANFQSTPTYNADIPTHYGLIDRPGGSGTISDYYFGAAVGSVISIIRFHGFHARSIVASESVKGLELSSFTSPIAIGVDISNLVGSTISRGIQITGITGGSNPRCIYTSGINQFHSPVGGDYDVLRLTRTSVAGGDEMGVLFEETSGYYSSRWSSEFTGTLRGRTIFYNNSTGQAGLGALAISGNLSSIGLALGTGSIATERLDVVGNMKGSGNLLLSNNKTIKLDATDGYIDLPDVSTELGGGVHNTGNGELWYNPGTYRLRYTRNDRNATVASVEDDFVGYSNLTSTSNPTMVGSEWYLEEFDGVSNAVNVTVGASLFEGKIYTVRCRRNVVAAGGNLITFYAASGYTFAVDGVSTLTPTSYTPGDYEVFTMRRMGTVIVINK